MDNKLLMKALAKSIAIVTVVSITCGALVGFIMSSGRIGITVGILTAVFQIVDSLIRGASTDRKNKEADFLAQQVLREASERKLPFSLNCSYCNAENRVGISFTEENTYNCTECKQENKVYIQFTSVRLTTPLLQNNNGIIIDDVEDAEIRQSTVNKPIVVNEA